MTPTDVINKLIGPITPVGDASRDPKRFDNLKEMCSTLDELIEQIRGVSEERHSKLGSVKKAGDYAYDFLEELGII